MNTRGTGRRIRVVPLGTRAFHQDLHTMSGLAPVVVVDGTGVVEVLVVVFVAKPVVTLVVAVILAIVVVVFVVADVVVAVVVVGSLLVVVVGNCPDRPLSLPQLKLCSTRNATAISPISTSLLTSAINDITLANPPCTLR